jgi:small-conductance mechanosensitive channel
MMEWLQSVLGSEIWMRTVIAAVIVLVFLFLSRAVKFILHVLGRRVFARTATVLDDRILGVLLAQVRPLMVVTGLHVGVREVRKGAPPSEVTINQVLDYADAVLYVVVVVLVLRVVLGIARVLIEWYLESLSSDGAADVRRTLGPLTSKTVNILVGLVAVIIILDHFGINIGSLLVSLGVGSLAVALAAQDTIANMIAGFVILVDRPFRVGDRIQLANGQVGDVDAIGLRSTRLLNADANLIIIPNAELVKTQIVNYAYPHHQMRVVVKVGVAYGSDSARIRQILQSLADNHPQLLKQPPPQVFCTALLDSAVEFTLVARTSDYTRAYETETTLREKIHEELTRQGIDIPYPQRVVHMKAGADGS